MQLNKDYKLTQKDFDELIEWLRDFKENRLFEIDRNLEIFKNKYPNEVVGFETFQKEYSEKIELFYNNVYNNVYNDSIIKVFGLQREIHELNVYVGNNDSIIKVFGLQREIYELNVYVSIIFDYLKNKHKVNQNG